MRLWAPAVVVLIGVALLAPPASAATPTSTWLTVPGDAGPHSGTWQGDHLSGHPDATGPPAAFCTPNECDQEQLVVQAEDPNYIATHALTCTIWLTYDGQAGNVFDLALLDGMHRLIKAANRVAPGQPLVISGIPTDHFFVEVDSDVATQPTSYVGHVALSATPTSAESSIAAPPQFAAAPPLVPPDPPPAALPRFSTVGPTIGPGVSAPSRPADPPPVFGTPAIKTSADASHGSGITLKFVLFGTTALGLIWLGRRFRQAWRRAGQPEGRV